MATRPDLWALYRDMLYCRRFEEVVASLWRAGRISGEMHLGTGEEAIVAGVLDHLEEGDALALDHRGTAAMLLHGVDPALLLREMLGRPDGLCRGHGGHMHLFSREHLAASSGIVGASGPAGAGFALAATYLRPGTLAATFFGEGAMNQGMLMESLNLAVVWNLPVLFVCKDNEWAITTQSDTVTGGSLAQRAGSFGMPAAVVEGTDVEAVWRAAGGLIAGIRSGKGPAFLHARCIHLEGHFLGDPLLRTARGQEKRPLGELLRAATRPLGAGLAERVRTLAAVNALVGQMGKDHDFGAADPVHRTRKTLVGDPTRLLALEDEVERQVQHALDDVEPSP